MHVVNDQHGQFTHGSNIMGHGGIFPGADISFSSLFHSAPALLAITTLAEGRFIEVNAEFVKKCGYTREEVIGMTSADIGMWQDYADRERMVKMLVSYGKVNNQDFYFRDKVNNVFAGLFSAELIEINGERCILLFITDITERKRLEEQIEVLNTDLMARKVELEMANAELEAFNYTVSHDLNGPLTIIGGFSQLLLEQCGNDLAHDHLDYLMRIQEGARIMEKLIASLLCFSRLARCDLNRDRVNLSGLAMDIIGGLKARAPERKATCIIQDGVSVTGDPRFLRIALENLLGNAWKYSSKKEETVIEFGKGESKGRPCYFVKDNGAGFDPKHAGVIFTPFKRLHSDREFAGHGIGLATVSRIIQRHGGSIWAEAEPGKGARFCFTV